MKTIEENEIKKLQSLCEDYDNEVRNLREVLKEAYYHVNDEQVRKEIYRVLHQ